MSSNSSPGHPRRRPERHSRRTSSGRWRASRARRDERASLLERFSQLPPPLLYVIVASGNIYEDRTAAVAAAQAGAQVIAVIRSTGQSLLDFVPFGPTTEGFGGTYATQANFAHHARGARRDRRESRTLRHAHQLRQRTLHAGDRRRWRRSSGLDMLLNDSMYGILFRDINMKRTFVDQHFSRMLNAYSGIIINTGEDNYLTTADAVEQAPAVLASQFINEEFAHRAGLPDRQIGLGDAYEIDPDLRGRLSLSGRAGAAGARDLPGRAAQIHAADQTHDRRRLQGPSHRRDVQPHVGDDAARASISAGCSTEAIHTPFLGDRALSFENARYVMNTARHFGDEIVLAPGRHDRAARARRPRRCEALTGARRGDRPDGRDRGRDLCRRFARPDGGRGFDGVFARAPGVLSTRSTMRCAANAAPA